MFVRSAFCLLLSRRQDPQHVPVFGTRIQIVQTKSGGSQARSTMSVILREDIEISTIFQKAVGKED